MEIHRLEASREADLFRVLAGEEGCAWCACTAWHLPSWEGFPSRSAADNRALREAVHARGEHDGYLAYDGGEPIGWCQAAPAAALPRVAAFLDEAPAPGDWAITCFEVRPEHRRRGVCRALLEHALADLPARGARRVLAFPKRGADEANELWNGPEATFRAAGFELLRDDAKRPVLARALGG